MKTINQNKIMSFGVTAILTAVMLVSTPAAAATCVTQEIVRTSSAQTTIDSGVTVATYQSPLWQPAFQDAVWIWSDYLVVDPNVSTTRVFSETFTLSSNTTSSNLVVSADDYYRVIVNGTEFAAEMGDGNFLPTNVHTYDISSLLVSGTNIVSFEVTNVAHNQAVHGTVGTSQNNPAGLLFRLEITDQVCSSSSIGGGGYPQLNSVTPAAPSQTAITENNIITLDGSSANADTVSPDVAGVIALADIEDPKTETVREESTPSVQCVSIALLLVLAMFATWKSIERHVSAKFPNISVRRLEITFYAIAFVLILAALMYFGMQCPIPMFVIGSLVLIIVRTLRRS